MESICRRRLSRKERSSRAKLRRRKNSNFSFSKKQFFGKFHGVGKERKKMLMTKTDAASNEEAFTEFVHRFTENFRFSHVSFQRLER